MNDQHDRYRTMAQWDAYVEPLIDTLRDVQWDRLAQQVTDWAGNPPRMKGLRGLHRPILSRKRRPGHMKYMRRLVRYWYVKQDAKDEPKALNLREYAAARLLRIARVLGTYKQFGSTIGGETKWVPGRDLGAVLNGDRTPATVGKVLGMIDWFQHCLAAFEGRAVAPAVKTHNVKAPAPNRLEQILVDRDKFGVDDLDTLAKAVGLVNDAGLYCLDKRKLGAVVGFCEALISRGKLTGARENAAPIVGRHFGVDVGTNKMGSNIAKTFFRNTLSELKKAD